MIYSEQQLERGCSIVYNGPDIIGDEDENFAKAAQGGSPGLSSSINEAVQVKG